MLKPSIDTSGKPYNNNNNNKNRNKSKKFPKQKQVHVGMEFLKTKQQTNKMGVTTQYIYNIPTSCAIWPTMHSYTYYKICCMYISLFNNYHTQLSHNSTHKIDVHYRLSTTHSIASHLQDNLYLPCSTLYKIAAVHRYT